ncbi:MAG: dienelactone hydrolase family protein [Bacteroidota bacterium]
MARLSLSDVPDAAPLTWKGDLAEKMVAGIRKYLERETKIASGNRPKRAPAAARRELARIIGMIDERVPTEVQQVAQLWPPLAEDQADADGDFAGKILVRSIRLSVLKGVEAEGLELIPLSGVKAVVIAIPDADHTPEMIAGLAPGLPEDAQFARRLAEAGCQVFIPTIINRDCEYSGVPGLMTNQPHREFIYRAAYELGRHIIGYEVQKVLAAVDYITQRGKQCPIGVMGYGEGGLLAFYAAALDTRIDAACVSGYFGPREGLFEEPIYRNTWSLLREFGDAEIAALVAPRSLIIEHTPVPVVSGPPVREGRSGAAPGKLTTPALSAIRNEVNRALTILGERKSAMTLTQSDLPGGEDALEAFIGALGCPEATSAGATFTSFGPADPVARHKRQFDQLVEHTQHLMRESEYVRRDYWKNADGTDVKSWVKTTKRYRKQMWEDVIGALPEPTLSLNPRARQVYDTDAFRGYEIVLDVFDDVFSYGILLVPKHITPGERRPVVVCQHGLEGRPQHVADPNVVEPYYKLFACRLAERGYVTFAPQNPYIGGDRFRVLQRLANPLKLSLFSFIIRQHERILEFLKTLPYVDGKRIGFYGLSYGGKTAMRVPAIVEGYALSICSGDFNEWIWKNCSVRNTASYMRTGEWEMFEFNLGSTFNYAEMSYLICPRPFMVERGHFDGCAPDEWVGYEYAKTQARYDLLGIGDRTELELFNGPHEIHAVGTFAFLDKHLKG